LEKACWSVEQCLVGGKSFWVRKLVCCEVGRRGAWEGRILAKEEQMGEKTEASEVVNSERE
jgi:hypothetical protein